MVQISPTGYMVVNYETITFIMELRITCPKDMRFFYSTQRLHYSVREKKRNSSTKEAFSVDYTNMGLLLLFEWFTVLGRRHYNCTTTTHHPITI